jgi:hypothetical protein
MPSLYRVYRTGDLQLLDLQQISGIMTRLQQKLAQQVTSYVVSRMWLPVVALPSTTSCKTDRRRVSRWVDQFSSATLENIPNLSTTHSALLLQTEAQCI